MPSAILVGQGLAGTVLGWELLFRDWDIRVVDDHHRGSCSLIAAGMWNPVSFRNLQPVWKASLALEQAEFHYRRIDRALGMESYHPMQLLRIFPHAGEANDWEARNSGETPSPYLGPASADTLPGLVAPYGHGEVHGAGWLNLKLLLQRTRQEWLARGWLISESFDAGSLDLTGSRIRYKDLEADRIIFCTGTRTLSLPGWGDLPIQPNKGEVLTLASDRLPGGAILNFGGFLLPTGDGTFRLGATFDPRATDPDPTEDGKKHLLENFGRTITGVPFSVIRHDAGWRPTVKDRRPVIGLSPADARIGVFNGLGSRGVTYAPYCASQLAGHLQEGLGIDPALSILRHL